MSTWIFPPSTIDQNPVLESCLVFTDWSATMCKVHFCKKDLLSMYQKTWLFTIQLGKPQHLLVVGVVVKDVKKKVLAHTSSNGSLWTKTKNLVRKLFFIKSCSNIWFMHIATGTFLASRISRKHKKANEGSKGRYSWKRVSATRFLFRFAVCCRSNNKKTFATNKLKQRNVKINFLVF